MISIDSPTFNFFFSLFHHLHCYTIKSISINVFNAAKIQKRLNSTVSIHIRHLSFEKPSKILSQIYIYIHISSKIIFATNFLLSFLWPLRSQKSGTVTHNATQRIETKRINWWKHTRRFQTRDWAVPNSHLSTYSLSVFTVFPCQ